MDGYHLIPLDEKSQSQTIFITKWGHLMYLRIPQGYLASGDVYPQFLELVMYDKIIKDVPHKVKIVDDA